MNDKIELSVICCYNNKEMYNKTIIKSLQLQSYQNFEIVGIDNTSNHFKCAADALNFGVIKSKGKLLLFVHQDFEFIGIKALENFMKFFDEITDNDILGCAGATLDYNASFLKRVIGRNRNIISTLDGNKCDLESLTECCSVDECCFGCTRRFWDKHKFDGHLCLFWDLYAVEYCLFASCNNGKVYVAPISAIHHSGGNLTGKFYKSLFRISAIYKDSIKYIVTPCVVTRTKYMYFEYIKLIFINLLRQLKRKLDGGKSDE